jgi:hypothetical protein
MDDKALFGGAIACRLPIDCVDLSDIRPVPSHQECWILDNVDDYVDVETDRPRRAAISFTIELLQRQDDVPDETIVAVLFRDLAETTGATAFRLVTEPSAVALPHHHHDGTGIGMRGQRATGEWIMPAPSPGRNNNDNDVRLHAEICVIRLPAQTTEILMTILVPLQRRVGGNGDEDNHGDNRRDDYYKAQARLWMDEMVASFRVLDWGLFGTVRDE